MLWTVMCFFDKFIANDFEEKYVPMLFYCCAAGQMMIVQKYA